MWYNERNLLEEKVIGCTAGIPRSGSEIIMATASETKDQFKKYYPKVKNWVLDHSVEIELVATTALAIIIPACFGAPLLPIIAFQAVAVAFKLVDYFLVKPHLDKVEAELADFKKQLGEKLSPLIEARDKAIEDLGENPDDETKKALVEEWHAKIMAAKKEFEEQHKEEIQSLNNKKMWLGFGSFALNFAPILGMAFSPFLASSVTGLFSAVCTSSSADAIKLASPTYSLISGKLGLNFIRCGMIVGAWQGLLGANSNAIAKCATGYRQGAHGNPDDLSEGRKNSENVFKRGALLLGSAACSTAFSAVFSGFNLYPKLAKIPLVGQIMQIPDNVAGRA